MTLKQCAVFTRLISLLPSLEMPLWIKRLMMDLGFDVLNVQNV